MTGPWLAGRAYVLLGVWSFILGYALIDWACPR